MKHARSRSAAASDEMERSSTASREEMERNNAAADKAVERCSAAARGAQERNFAAMKETMGRVGTFEAKIHARFSHLTPQEKDDKCNLYFNRERRLLAETQSSNNAAARDAQERNTG